jgi:hypothetical protein
MATLGDRLRAGGATATQAVSAGQLRPTTSSQGSEDFLGREPVRHTSELQRILDLPRRTWSPDAAQALADKWTATLRRPNGNMRLKPVQGVALEEASTVGGLLGPIKVGGGKTLVALLAPVVMGAKTAILLLPPQLKTTLLTLTYPQLASQWRVPNVSVGTGGTAYDPTQVCSLDVIAYSELSSTSGSELLDRRSADVVVCDEAHTLASLDSRRAARFERFVQRNPNCRFVFLSGTMVNDTIARIGRLSKWALGKKSPLPLAYRDMERWSAALDPSPFPAPPGDLERLCPGEDVREGFRRRLRETPGVVSSQPEELGISLVINERKVTIPPVVDKALSELRRTWVTPGGEWIEDALSFSRYARQLSAGLYYRWRKQPPKEWIEARREWHSEVRDFLKHEAKPGMDSKALLESAIRKGDRRSYAFQVWDLVKTLHDANDVEAVWIDDFLARDAAAWATKNVGIIWTQHSALGLRIAELSGCPFYEGGDESAVAIETERGDRTVIASVNAHGTGRNLQKAFSRQLVTTASSGGNTWEQLLGRTHRPGQPESTVQCDVYLHTPELRAAFEKARARARFVEETTGERGKEDQKLVVATYTFKTEP